MEIISPPEKLKYFIHLIIILGLLHVSRTQKCASRNITNSEFEYGFTFKEALSLNFSGVIESFLMTGTERIYDTSNNNWPVNYIDARYARGVLEVYTTPNFKKYVEEQSSSRINLAVTLVCEDQSRPILVFRINIKRENLYEPTFTKPFYDITIPLPLYKGFDLTTFQPISARDIDIFDNRVTFSTNYTGIVEVKTKPDADEDGKTFYAMLKLTAPLVSLSKPLEFIITAMDSGQPARFSSARVRLTADEAITFIHPPKFEKNLYIGELNDTLALNVEAPILTFETWTADVKLSKSGTDADLFALITSNNRVQIGLARPLTDADVEDRSFFSFVLIATRSDDMTGSCSVVIEIPQKSTEHRFAKPYYTGSINKFGNLSLETILYDMEDYTPDTVFTLKGPDVEFFKVSNTEANVQIDFVSNITEVNFEDRRYLFILLSAVREDIEIANTGITILLPVVPKFDKTLYKGLVNKEGKFTIETIHFEVNIAPEVKSVSLRGNMSERFMIKGSREEMLLDVKTPFSEMEIRTVNFIPVTIVAVSRADVEGTAEIIIDFPTYRLVPSFEKPVYKGKLDKDSKLVLEDIVLSNKTYSEGIQFVLEGDLADYFEENVTFNIIHLQSKQPLPDFILKNQKYLNLALVARNADSESATTSIVLDMPKYVAPEFTKLLFKGTLDRYFQLNLEEISLRADTYDSEITVSLVGNDAKYFNAKLNSVTVIIEINDAKLNPDELTRRTSLDFTIIAENHDGLSGKTSVSMELPAICGPGSGTCPPCVFPSSETCAQATTPDPNSAPVFDRKLYLYRIEPFYLGVIGVLAAKIPASTENVIFSLDISNDHLKLRLSLQQSTGQIAVNELISPGLYTFQAIAMNPITGAKGYARVRLAIDTAMTCPNGTTVVSSSLIVKHIAEEKVHMDLLNAKFGRCLFIIYGMEPRDKGYVIVDNRTSQLATIAIDREDKIFEKMLIPQITVLLKLNCPGNGNIRARQALYEERATVQDSRSLIFTADIPFNPLLTTLHLIIDDINDNSPEFTFPPQDDYIVGYPEVDIYYSIMPEYLIKVEAIDRDDGLNAKIRYSLVENDYFQIDPETGIIYPLAKSTIPFKSIELTVVARDRDGAPSGRNTKIKIIVKQLLSSSLTLLTLSDQSSQNVESILKNVSQYIEGDVYSLRSAMLPAKTSDEDLDTQYERAEKKPKRQLMLRVWIYVVDANGDFVEGSNVERKLEDLRDDFDLEISAYQSQSENDALSVDAVGLIAGISVLGFLLFVGIAGAVTFWWIWLRPYNFKSISNETNSETVSSEGSLENELKYKSGNSYYYEGGDAYDPNQYKRRASMQVAGVTNVDTSDESNTNSLEGGYSNTSDNSDGSRGQNERKKSIVTFNELVERIDIEVNDNNFRQHGNSNNDDERL